MSTSLRHLPYLLLLLACCSKSSDSSKAEPATPPETKSEAPDQPVKAAPPPEVEPQPEVDYITATATHAIPKPTDPIIVHFEAFEVVEAKFDPKNLEGATAKLVVNVASLKTDKAGRDKHLREADYLDTERFATATALVSDVRPLGEGDDPSYQAKVVVELHGQTQTWEVDFVVAESTDSSVTIEMQHSFERRSFGIGAEDASPAQEILLKARVTFRK